MSRYKGDNSGGYGNPPIKGQFKEGGPGGPGRPKGSLSQDAALRKVFGGKVEYTINGEDVNNPVSLALAQRALALGMSGSLRANEAARELAERYGPVDETNEPKLDFDDFSFDELREFQRMMNKARGLPTEAFEPPPVRYYTKAWPDGVAYKIAHDGKDIPPQIETIRHRAYWSAALPMRLPPPDKD